MLKRSVTLVINLMAAITIERAKRCATRVRVDALILRSQVHDTKNYLNEVPFQPMKKQEGRRWSFAAAHLYLCKMILQQPQVALALYLSQLSA